MKKILVVGFVTDGKRVLLINKNRPANQKGLFNGVGGAVEENETPLDAMIREAKEETGLTVNDWTEIDVFPYDNGITLHLYQAIISPKEIEKFQSLTDEKVSLFNKNELPKNLYEDVVYIVKRRMVFELTPQQLFKRNFAEIVEFDDDSLHISRVHYTKEEAVSKFREFYASMESLIDEVDIENVFESSVVVGDGVNFDWEEGENDEFLTWCVS